MVSPAFGLRSKGEKGKGKAAQVPVHLGYRCFDFMKGRRRTGHLSSGCGRLKGEDGETALLRIGEYRAVGLSWSLRESRDDVDVLFLHVGADMVGVQCALLAARSISAVIHSCVICLHTWRCTSGSLIFPFPSLQAHAHTKSEISKKLNTSDPPKTTA